MDSSRKNESNWLEKNDTNFLINLGRILLANYYENVD